MRKSLVILLAGLACIMMIAAGCTSSSGTTPATTTAVTTAAATETATPSAPAAETTIVVTAEAANVTANVTTAAPVAAPSWTGTWNTSYVSSDKKPVMEVLTMNQTGSSVTGTYGKNSTGTINATVQESKLAGTWAESDLTGNYTGKFEFTLSADEKSFTGRWIDASENLSALANTTQTWDGVRV
ncbi:MAG: hypothetical protein LUQ66_04425 [Methanoregula sp.]|nr:hypothetical protein [Methanoregula sp.]